MTKENNNRLEYDCTKRLICAQNKCFCAIYFAKCIKCSNFAADFEISILHILYIMALKIVVLAKQVPDTRNVGKDAMTAEGTVNRAALPAIFNPEDLNALEQALRLKEQNPGSTVGILHLMLWLQPSRRLAMSTS